MAERGERLQNFEEHIAPETVRLPADIVGNRLPDNQPHRQAIPELPQPNPETANVIEPVIPGSQPESDVIFTSIPNDSKYEPQALEEMMRFGDSESIE